MKRRTFVATAGTLVAAGLAGCGDFGPGADNQTEPDEDGLGDGDTPDDVGNDTGGIGNDTDGVGNDTDGVGNDTDGVGNDTDGVGNETGGVGNETAGNDTAGNDTEAPTDDGNETQGVGNETATNGTEPADTGTPGATDDLNLEDVDGEVSQTPENLTLVDHQLVETEDGAAVVGAVRNMGGTTYSTVHVSVTLEDGGTSVDEETVSSEGDVSELGPGETWRFFVEFDGDDVSQATGYTITVEAEEVDEAA